MFEVAERFCTSVKKFVFERELCFGVSFWKDSALLRSQESLFGNKCGERKGKKNLLHKSCREYFSALITHCTECVLVSLVPGNAKPHLSRSARAAAEGNWFLYAQDEDLIVSRLKVFDEAAKRDLHPVSGLTAWLRSSLLV